jgi:hypothetical protein
MDSLSTAITNPKVLFDSSSMNSKGRLRGRANSCSVTESAKSECKPRRYCFLTHPSLVVSRAKVASGYLTGQTKKVRNANGTFQLVDFDGSCGDDPRIASGVAC